MPTRFHVVGAIVLSCSFQLLYLTYRENPYFSSAVRIQEERGQTVVSTGPYRCAPFFLFSRTPLFPRIRFLAGIVDRSTPGLLLGGILARRAVRKELVLQKGLKGYDVNMAQVK